MMVKAKLSALRNTQWYEYALRFGLGGLATVATGWIASRFGPVVGGLFLAFPAIFCASATLVEKHERQRKQKAGFKGARRGREAAALDASGAALGSLGLMVFALVAWRGLPAMGIGPTLAAGILAWLSVSLILWWARRFIRRRRPTFYRREVGEPRTGT